MLAACPGGLLLRPHPMPSLPHGGELGAAAAQHLWDLPAAGTLAGISLWMLQFGGHSWGTPSLAAGGWDTPNPCRKRGAGWPEAAGQGVQGVQAQHPPTALHVPVSKGGTGQRWPHSAVPGSGPRPPAQCPAGAPVPGGSSHFTLLTFTATVTTPSRPPSPFPLTTPPHSKPLAF